MAPCGVYDHPMNVNPRTRVRKDYTLDPRTVQDIGKLAQLWRCSASAAIDRAIAQAAGGETPHPSTSPVEARMGPMLTCLTDSDHSVQDASTSVHK
jgi:hypothetical protein